MERITQITPAFDHRNDAEKKQYGQHCCDIRMILKGELGAYQFLLYTGWYLSGQTQNPIPADVGYHAPTPQYESQCATGQHCEYNDESDFIGCKGEPTPCEYLDGKPCYYDGSTLRAADMFQTLLEKGSDGVWKELEEAYIHRFGELK